MTDGLKNEPAAAYNISISFTGKTFESDKTEPNKNKQTKTNKSKAKLSV